MNRFGRVWRESIARPSSDKRSTSGAENLCVVGYLRDLHYPFASVWLSDRQRSARSVRKHRRFKGLAHVDRHSDRSRSFLHNPLRLLEGDRSRLWYGGSTAEKPRRERRGKDLFTGKHWECVWQHEPRARAHARERAMRTIITINPRRNGHYLAVADGLQPWVSRTPFLVAARKLLALGYSPHETIVMRHSGSEVDCLTSTIGEAARLRVSEPDDGKQSPTFRPWRPYGASGGLSRIAPSARAATLQNAPATTSSAAAADPAGPARSPSATFSAATAATFDSNRAMAATEPP
jgi:hypothetical protein